MSTVTFGCPHCGKGIEFEPGTKGACRYCGGEVELAGQPDQELSRCLACDCEHLYRHRDFNQKAGLAIIGIGAALWIYIGHFWPMLVAAGLDLLLFYTIPDVAICYACKAHHRGFANVGTLPSFDLERHEHYRWKQHAEDQKGAEDSAPTKPTSTAAEPPAD